MAKTVKRLAAQVVKQRREAKQNAKQPNGTQSKRLKAKRATDGSVRPGGQAAARATSPVTARPTLSVPKRPQQPQLPRRFSGIGSFE
jgi:hypothetical protein